MRAMPSRAPGGLAGFRDVAARRRPASGLLVKSSPMAPPTLPTSRRREWLAASVAFLIVLLTLTATARSAKADGAKQGGDLAGVLATESKPMEAPRPKPKTVAKAKPSAHPAHAKPHHTPKAKHGKHAGAVKAAKAKPAKGPKAAKRGPKLRA